MLKPKISLIFKIGIEMPDLSYIIELDCLKNFCSVNYSPKGLVAGSSILKSEALVKIRKRIRKNQLEKNLLKRLRKINVLHLLSE